jgi:hypothetical protein
MAPSGSGVSGITGEGSDSSKITYNNYIRNNNLSARGKVLYRQSKALVTEMSGIIANDNNDTKEEKSQRRCQGSFAAPIQ